MVMMEDDRVTMSLEGSRVDLMGPVSVFTQWQVEIGRWKGAIGATMKENVGKYGWSWNGGRIKVGWR